MPEKEYLEAIDGVMDAGYLRLKWSDIVDAYCVDYLETRKAFRRRGIASKLMKQAESDLGYPPAPEAILHNDAAQSFWQQRGQSAFNQAILEV